MPRPRPSLPPLTIPHQDFVEQWLDHFGDSDSIDEHPEYSLNLGAESPASNLSFDDRIPTPPPRVFSRRKLLSPRAQRKREGVDRDCGICFEYAVQPSRTLCCGKIFCLEHITDWLHGPSSDGRCPSCSAPCSTTNILSLASPTLISKPVPNRPKPTATSTSRDAATITWSDPSFSMIPNHTPATRVRSQSASTSTSTSKHSRTSTSSFTSSIDSSVLGLSPAPEESLDADDGQGQQHWLAYALGFTHSFSRSHSSSPLVTPPAAQAPSQPSSPYPLLDPGSSTVEVLSRLASVMGLTLLFYALLAS